jgi:hypothetical protein
LETKAFVLKPFKLLLTALCGIIILHPCITSAQKNKNVSTLFTRHDVLQLKLYANYKSVQKDRGKSPSYHPALLSYKNDDSIDVSIPLKIKVRGNFRKDRANCFFPPLLLNFPKHYKDSAGLFMNQNTLKLVTQCKSDDYVVREYLVYKLYNLVTEKSFRARLVRVDYVDSSSKLKTETHYGILIEDENAMAQRNGAIIVKRKMIIPEATNREEYIKMTVFQYMIGNTDWSIPYLHNIRLISPDSTRVPYTVPYDFDYSGIVNTPYAIPPEELGIASVRDRLYRGYCMPSTDFDDAVKLFNKIKDDVYKTYTGCTLLSSKYIKQTTDYLDNFYKTINNQKLRNYEFSKHCSDESRIAVKGLKTTTD